MKYEDRMRSIERELVLEVIDGKIAKNVLGMMDPRLFTGEQRLFAVQDTQTMLWSLKYYTGAPPAALRQQFTSFQALLRFTKAYFLTRNIQIVKVID